MYVLMFCFLLCIGLVFFFVKSVEFSCGQPEITGLANRWYFGLVLWSAVLGVSLGSAGFFVCAGIITAGSMVFVAEVVLSSLDMDIMILTRKDKFLVVARAVCTLMVIKF